MSEDAQPDQAAEATPVKKTPARKTSTKTSTRKTAAKKTTGTRSTAAKKTTAKRTAAKSTTAKSKTTASKAASSAAPEPEVEAEAPAAEAGGSTFDSSTSNAKSGESQDTYNGAQMLEDLKGRNWPEIIKRAVLMFFFGVLGSVALWVAFVLAAVQVVFTIFAGEANPALTRVIKQCSGYISDVLEYLSFATDESPFPFDRSFPDGE